MCIDSPKHSLSYVEAEERLLRGLWIGLGGCYCSALKLRPRVIFFYSELTHITALAPFDPQENPSNEVNTFPNLSRVSI